mgnify:CR=1 FL=1
MNRLPELLSPFSAQMERKNASNKKLTLAKIELSQEDSMQIRDGILNPLSLNLNTSGGGINRQTVNSNFAGKLRHAARESTLFAQKAVGSGASFVPAAAIFSAALRTAASHLARRGRMAQQTLPPAVRGDTRTRAAAPGAFMARFRALKTRGWQRATPMV